MGTCVTGSGTTGTIGGVTGPGMTKVVAFATAKKQTMPERTATRRTEKQFANMYATSLIAKNMKSYLMKLIYVNVTYSVT